MFSYYGSKSKLRKKYPNPDYGVIIEPFAGAAWYSIEHRDHRVILNEKYDAVYEIWRWLINDARPEDILSHTDFFAGDDVSSLDVPQGHRNLIGFSINRGSNAPRNIVQKWSCQVKERPNWASTTAFALKRAACLLPEIKHWRVIRGDYKDLPNIKATWFIDPPYQFGGERYQECNINYQDLLDFCMSRKGQVIVCENTKAKWISVEPIATQTGQRHKTQEGIFHRR